MTTKTKDAPAAVMPAHYIPELRPLDWFRGYDRNPRKKDHNVAPLAEAIAEFGFRYAMLASFKRDPGLIADGHRRLGAVRWLEKHRHDVFLAKGLHVLPVCDCDDMTPEQVRAFRISVGRMAELGAWEPDTMRSELEAALAAGFKGGLDGPLGAELDDEVDEALGVRAWDMSQTEDVSVITITSTLPLEAEVRARLRGLEGAAIEVSSLKRPRARA